MGHDRSTGPGEKAQVSSQLLGQSVRARLVPRDTHACMCLAGQDDHGSIAVLELPTIVLSSLDLNLLSSYLFQTSYSCVIWADVGSGASSSCRIQATHIRTTSAGASNSIGSFHADIDSSSSRSAKTLLWGQAHISRDDKPTCKPVSSTWVLRNECRQTLARRRDCLSS